MKRSCWEGCFLQSIQKQNYADARFILSALGAWFIAALVLLAAASAIVNRAELGSGSMGYVSSAISFLSAFAAGARAGRMRKAGTLYTAAVSAAVITTLLLTVGFIIDGSDLEASGVLSVVSFTFAGCMAGCVFLGGGSKKKRRGNRTKFT